MKKFFFAVLSLVLVSCTTLQQDIMIDSASYSEEVLAFENRLVQFDADSLLSAVDTGGLLQFIADIDAAVSDPSIQKASLSRLLALEGRAYLLLGKKSKARDLYQESVEAYKGDSQSAVLARRLDLQIDAAASDSAILVLEDGIGCYSAKQYLEAVAKFDEAFLSLEPFYRESYGAVRDMAWNLRAVDSHSEVSDVLLLPRITVMQMLLLTRSHSNLLYNYTAGKTLGDRELFSRVSDAGLLSPVSQPAETVPALREGDVVTKCIGARFLWNLYNAKKNTASAATKYSERYARTGRASPVPDVPAGSPDFDAVLGCVEKEILSLDDGINFGGEKEISALEFNEYLKNVR